MLVSGYFCLSDETSFMQIHIRETERVRDEEKVLEWNTEKETRTHCIMSCYLSKWAAIGVFTENLFLSWRWGFPGGSDGKEASCNAGDLGSIPGLGRSPGEGKGNPLQYSCLENPIDRGAWRATVHGAAESRTRLSDSAHKLIEKGHFYSKF